MKGILKHFAAAAAFAGLLCGGAFALDENEIAVEHDSAYIAEDTTRDILGTLQSRLDAFRKVGLPQMAIPASEAAGVVVNSDASLTTEAGVAASADVSGGAALGSLILPEYEYLNYGSRYRNRFWTGGLGTWQNADRTADHESYKYRGRGVLLGYEHAQGAGVFGIAGSFVKGDYELGDSVRSDSEISQYSAHFYGAYNNSRGFVFSLAGGYTYGSTDLDETTHNTTERRTENYHSHTVNAAFKVGFDFEPSDTVVITPSIGANFFHTRSNRHNIGLSTFDPGESVFQDELRHNQIELPLDMQISKEIAFSPNRTLQLSAGGGYAYNLTNTAANGDLFETASNGTVTRLRAAGRELGRSAWKAGAGARLKMDQWDVGVKYDFLKRSDFDSHRLMGTVGFSF